MVRIILIALSFLYVVECGSAKAGQFQRVQSTPVLAKGSSYGGWQADALAAPGVCWDGSRFVMTVSLWSIANSQWASAFFTSLDLKSWSYVSGSLQVPSGGDYLLGNGGIAWFSGHYYFAYNHYGPTLKIALATSTDLITWTTVGSFPLFPLGASGSGDETGQADPSIAVNPTSGKLEIWYIGQDTRQTMMADSPDGSTWTKRGIFHAQDVSGGTDYGEPDVYYLNGTRTLTFDTALPGSSNRRNTRTAYSVLSDTIWTPSTIALTQNTSNAWEAYQVFDGCCVGVFDLGDGRGRQLWMVYAGSDIFAPTDNTDSSIGLAYLSPLNIDKTPMSSERGRVR